MKKLLLLLSLLVSGLLSAQTYPLHENFDAVTTSGTPATGNLPTGWTKTSGFAVYGMENLSASHGDSPLNACTTEMSATHTKDTLYTPMIGPITANTKVGLNYRFVNKAGYPANGYQLTVGDQITVEAYALGSWNSLLTINSTTNPNALSTYTTYTYTSSLISALAGQTIQLRMDIARANGDWYLDIDDFQVADVLGSGIATNAANTPSLSVFPNPSHGGFSLSLKNYQVSNQVEVAVYNLLGQKVKTVVAESAVNNQINVNTVGLEKGMYLVEVKSGSEVAKTKVQID
jgi:hypothetical protein